MTIVTFKQNKQSEYIFSNNLYNMLFYQKQSRKHYLNPKKLVSRFLHIVCLEMPFPADHGSAIDTMNRIKALHKKGIRIHLHYFKYNNETDSKELNRYCETIHAYEIKSMIDSFSLNTPYFVNCRCNTSLAEVLNKDNYPILLEGLHTTGIINTIHHNGRKICVRMHNEPSIYHRELARCTSNPAKKTYHLAESMRAKKYTATLPKTCMYACVSEQDKASLTEQGFHNVQIIAPFPSWQQVSYPRGIGSLCLFHGNLSVPENEKAALWLLCNVFNNVRIPFVIAGKNPSNALQKAACLCENTCIIGNLGETEMNDLVQKAHINILPCFNKNITGIRMKLLHALYSGRHCITTPAMVEGSGLEDACHIGASAHAIASIISQLYYLPFEEEEVRLRKKLLESRFDNDQNAERFIDYLW